MTETNIAETEVLTLQLHGAIQSALNIIEQGTFTVSGQAFLPIAADLEVLRKFHISLQDGHIMVVTPQLSEEEDEHDAV